MKHYFKHYIAILTMFFVISCMPAFADNVSNTPANSVEIQTKQPIGRKALAIKFIMAMLGVGVSSILIYVLLASYNKFVYGSSVRYEQSEEDNDLKTPNNMKDALNIFLKKTK